MLYKLSVGVVLVASLGFAVSAPPGASKPSLKSVGDRLLCQCGCRQTLNSCNHLVCGARTEMTALVEKEIAEGKSENLILGDFVLRYGAQVLATPPAKGLDLTVWILPGFGLIVGLAVVVLLVRRFRKPKEVPAAPAEPLDPTVLAAVEEEMKKLTG